MTGPLSTLKVLDFTTLLPGPFATMYLADLGADVIHIEAPNRPDLLRLQPPFLDADGQVSASYAALNRSKRSLGLNLKHPDGPAIVKQLVTTYDIVIEQFRPGVMARLGVGYEQLCEANPALIYCAISGYGQEGPLAQRAGHDLNYLALSGLLSYSGHPDTGPHPLGTQIADIGGGTFGALVALLAAVIHRYHTGEGQMVDISMLDGAIAWNVLAGSDYLAGGDVPTYDSLLLNGGSQYRCYETADGRYLAAAPLEPHFWQGFCEAIDRPDLIGKLSLPGSPEMDALQAEIAETIKARSLAAWQEIFAARDVCVEPVLSLDEMAGHPHTRARRMIVDVDGPAGRVRQLANPLRFSKTSPSYRHYGVPTGYHSHEILEGLGYEEAQIEALAEAGVIG
jgi:crotonobetainyl-CoA:carnitine CoA-transferase CaiB-like acyl-CoA transferase